MMTAILALTSTVTARQDTRPLTLPEIVLRVAPQPVHRGRIRELVPLSLEQMVPTADLIVHGIVELRSTYLSVDQTELYTDYWVNPRRVFAQRSVATTSAPGAAPPIVLKRWGGKTLLDGVSVTVEDHDLRDFRSGEELLLVLIYDNADGKYRIAGDISGAFAVAGRRILPLVQHPIAERVRNLSLDEFDTRVRQLWRQ